MAKVAANIASGMEFLFGIEHTGFHLTSKSVIVRLIGYIFFLSSEVSTDQNVNILSNFRSKNSQRMVVNHAEVSTFS